MMNQESQSCLKTFLILTCWVNGPLSNSTFILKGSTFIPLLCLLCILKNRLWFSLDSGEIFLANWVFFSSVTTL